MASVLAPQQFFPAFKQNDPTNGANMLTPTYNTMTKQCIFESRQYQPATAVSNLGNASTFIDFQVSTGSDLHALSDLMVQFTVQTSGTGTFYLMPSPYLLEYLQILTDSQVRQMYYPSYILNTILATYPDQTLKTLLPLMSASQPSAAAAYNSPGVVAITGAATTQVYLPLTLFCWFCNGVLLPQVTSPIRIRLQMAVASRWLWSNSTGGASNISITNIQLYGSGVIYKDFALTAVTKQWQSASHIFPTLAPTLKDFGLGSLSQGNTSAKQTFMAVKGYYPGALCQVIDQSGAVNETILTPLKADIQFYDAGGMFINYLNTSDLQRYQESIQFPYSQKSQPNSYSAFSYFIPFVLSYYNCLKSAGCCAGIEFVGTESITVKPTANSLTSGMLYVHLSQSAVYTVFPVSGLVAFKVFDPTNN